MGVKERLEWLEENGNGVHPVEGLGGGLAGVAATGSGHGAGAKLRLEEQWTKLPPPGLA